MTATLPTREPTTRALQTLASAAITLVLGLALWPPEAVYWTALADRVGDPPTLALVALLSIGLGAWLARTTEFGPGVVLGGGVLAYAVGMVGIEVALAPNSPVHLVWYAILLAGLVGGALIWIGAQRYRDRF